MTYLVILILGAGMAVTGTVLFRRSFLSRRVGKSPHCRMCDYIVGGIKTPRCPECGADLLGTGAIVYGDRVVRRWRRAIGIALVLVGIGVCLNVWGSAMRQINWYRLRPTSWVMSDLRSNDQWVSSRAWRELVRRREANKLSDAHQGEIMEAVLVRLEIDPSLTFESELYFKQRMTALSTGQRERLFAAAERRLKSNPGSSAVMMTEVLVDEMMEKGMVTPQQFERLTELALEHQETGEVPAGAWLLELLGEWELAGRLTAQQRERFYHQALDAAGLEVRSTTIIGDRVPFRFSLTGRMPASYRRAPAAIWLRHQKVERVLADDQPVEAGPIAGDGFAASSTWSWVRVTKPGRHTLEVVITLSIHHQVPSQRNGPPARFRREVKLSAPFVALERAPPDYIKWIQDPSQAAALERSIRPDYVKRGWIGPGGLSMTLHADKPPVPVAFEVLGRLDGKEHPIAMVTMAADGQAVFNIGTRDFPPTPHHTIDVILRSSEEAIKETIDMYEAWKGEVVFEGVPIKE